MGGSELILPAEAGGAVSDDQSVVVIPEAAVLPTFSGDWTSPGVSKLARSVKRGMDLVGALVAITIFLPLMLVIATAICLSSPGAPIFVHRRVGRFGRPFRMIKFRTMKCGSTRDLATHVGQDDGLASEWSEMQKLRADPRVTALGRTLRKFSLDELPQLLNVVAGHMSLVGPRPVVREELPRFGDAAKAVLSVRPGLTGLWTVNGRSDVSYEDRVALEARYVREWSLGLDVAILMKTIPCAIMGRGAY